jgi:hypothetical protein
MTRLCHHPSVPASLSPTLADAHDSNYVEFSTSYARRRGSELRRDASVDRAIIDLPALPYNGVFRSNLPQVTLPGSRPRPLRSPELVGFRSHGG